MCFNPSPPALGEVTSPWCSPSSGQCSSCSSKVTTTQPPRVHSHYTQYWARSRNRERHCFECAVVAFSTRSRSCSWGFARGNSWGNLHTVPSGKFPPSGPMFVLGQSGWQCGEALPRRSFCLNLFVISPHLRNGFHSSSFSTLLLKLLRVVFQSTTA